MISLRSYIKHSNGVFYRVSKHLEICQKKKFGCASFFNPLSLGVWISWWNTLHCVWYITRRRSELFWHLGTTFQKEWVPLRGNDYCEPHMPIGLLSDDHSVLLILRESFLFILSVETKFNLSLLSPQTVFSVFPLIALIPQFMHFEMLHPLSH